MKILKYAWVLITGLFIVMAIKTGIARYNFISNSKKIEGTVVAVADKRFGKFGTCKMVVRYIFGSEERTGKFNCISSPPNEVGGQVTVMI